MSLSPRSEANSDNLSDLSDSPTESLHEPEDRPPSPVHELFVKDIITAFTESGQSEAAIAVRRQIHPKQWESVCPQWTRDLQKAIASNDQVKASQAVVDALECLKSTERRLENAEARAEFWAKTLHDERIQRLKISDRRRTLQNDHVDLRKKCKALQNQITKLQDSDSVAGEIEGMVDGPGRSDSVHRHHHGEDKSTNGTQETADPTHNQEEINKAKHQRNSEGNEDTCGDETEIKDTEKGHHETGDDDNSKNPTCPSPTTSVRTRGTKRKATVAPLGVLGAKNNVVGNKKVKLTS